jgi:ubiquinone/menaquinone biosynthesis C-methylase UbiE
MGVGVAPMTTLSSSLAGSENLAKRLDLRLRCPRCSANLSAANRFGSDCLKCGLFLNDVGGIIQALPPVRADHYAQFIADYEHIRIAEGRGSGRDNFYLALPYRDVSGRNSSQWRIRARTWDFLMKRVLAPTLLPRESILDLGAGNCWMSFRLAQAGYKPIAVDLHDNSFDGMGAAEHFRQSLPGLFPRFRAELAHLPFQDEQFDAAIFNASFHYVEDAAAALAEALRCVKPGGLLIICDTPWYSCDESGYEMVQERRMSFMKRYGTASASLQSVEFLTDERLQSLEERLAIRWTVHSPNYGLPWAMRPFVAKLRNRREPARFRIYVAQKAPASSDVGT